MMNSTYDRGRRQARATRARRTRRKKTSILHCWYWDSERQRAKVHIHHCRDAPTDPHEREMFVLAASMDYAGGTRERALRELIEIDRQNGSRITARRMKQIVALAYGHPQGYCRNA